MYERYQMREAAGMYWIMDMEQEPLQYKPPICINSVGAWIWENLASGLSREETVQKFALRYDIPIEEARHDCQAFFAQLQGILDSPR